MENFQTWLKRANEAMVRPFIIPDLEWIPISNLRSQIQADFRNIPTIEMQKVFWNICLYFEHKKILSYSQECGRIYVFFITMCIASDRMAPQTRWNPPNDLQPVSLSPEYKQYERQIITVILYFFTRPNSVDKNCCHDVTFLEYVRIVQILSENKIPRNTRLFSKFHRCVYGQYLTIRETHPSHTQGDINPDCSTDAIKNMLKFSLQIFIAYIDLITGDDKLDMNKILNQTSIVSVIQENTDQTTNIRIMQQIAEQCHLPLPEEIPHGFSNALFGILPVLLLFF